MKTITGKYYQCVFCGRKMFGAGAMSYHEKWCRENPKNKHICFAFCKHLKRSEKYVWSDWHEEEIFKTEFTCKITKQKMYSYNLVQGNPEVFSFWEELNHYSLFCLI